MLHFHLKACPKCHGDLALDEGDWLCLQCGTYYYTGLYPKPVLLPVSLPATQTQIEDRGGEPREKALPVPSRAVGGLSQFPDMAMTASGLGGLPDIGIQPGPASARRFDDSTFIGIAAVGIGGLDRASL